MNQTSNEVACFSLDTVHCFLFTNLEIFFLGCNCTDWVSRSEVKPLCMFPKVLLNSNKFLFIFLTSRVCDNTRFLSCHHGRMQLCGIVVVVVATLGWHFLEGWRRVTPPVLFRGEVHFTWAIGLAVFGDDIPLKGTSDSRLPRQQTSPTPESSWSDS